MQYRALFTIIVGAKGNSQVKQVLMPPKLFSLQQVLEFVIVYPPQLFGIFHLKFVSTCPDLVLLKMCATYGAQLLLSLSLTKRAAPHGLQQEKEKSLRHLVDFIQCLTMLLQILMLKYDFFIWLNHSFQSLPSGRTIQMDCSPFI